MKSIRKDRYHAETEFYYRHGLCDSRTVLIPNTMTLRSFFPNINIYETPIPEQLCYRFAFLDLQKIYSELLNVTSCSKLSNEKARKTVRMCRDSCKCGKIDFVRERVKEALELYHTLEHNYDGEKERVYEVQKYLIRIPDEGDE